MRDDERLFELADGRPVLIRSLTGSDSAALAAALRRADHDDLRRRFMGSPPPLRVVIAMLKSADGVHDAAVGAFDPDGRLVGVAQFDRVDDLPRAEVAVEVATAYQDQGLGSALARHIARLALERGITTFTVSYFADNTAVERLLGKVGTTAPVTIRDGDAECEVRLDRVGNELSEKT